MRSTVLALVAAAFLASTGCKPVPKEQRVQLFKTQAQRYFNNLNADAQMRAVDLRSAQTASENNPGLKPPTGRVMSTYEFDFDDQAFIVTNYACKVCKTKLTVPVLTTLEGDKRRPWVAETLCRACGHCPFRDHPTTNFVVKKAACSTCCTAGDPPIPKAPDAEILAKERFLRAEGATVKDMFEVTEENPEKPMRAKVRYVRHLWVYDLRGAVTASERAMNKYASSNLYVPARITETSPADAPFSLPGFHRQDGVYVGEVEFELSGGNIAKLPPGEKEHLIRPWKDLAATR